MRGALRKQPPRVAPRRNPSALIERYLEAQQGTTDATAHAGDIFAKYQLLTWQAQADECGDAAQRLCDVHVELLPKMRENGEVARRCLKGFLSVSPPTTNNEREELRELQSSTRQARISTEGDLRSIQDGRKTALLLRKRNLARSLNESQVCSRET